MNENIVEMIECGKYKYFKKNREEPKDIVCIILKYAEYGSL